MFYLSGKALKISKKPCTDPSGKNGICTFKWDCINNNGTLMGTCVDGFIFGTCCHYGILDPFLLDNNPLSYQDSNKISDYDKFIGVQTPSTTTSSSTTPSTVATRRPIQIIRLTTTPRPKTTTIKPPTAPTSASSSGQLVTWTSIGPTRPPQRPIILQPFPFRPGSNFPVIQGGWPLGIAFPVDPFQINRPLQVLRPPVMLQSAQSTIISQSPAIPENNASYTILNGPDKTTQRTSTTNSIEKTTVSVPIPQWSTVSSSQSRPTGTSSFAVKTTVKPALLVSSNISTASHTSSASTGKPLKKPLDYRKGK